MVLSASAGAFVLVVIFMRIAYISMPLGVGPIPALSLRCCGHRRESEWTFSTNLLHGLATIFTPLNFAVMVIGLVLGMLVAVLPGLTLVMGVVLALPFTYKMGVEPALILLTAMYVSGTYGGAITSILFRIPGEPMDVPLLWDGYAMTRRGEAAKALGWSLMAALIGGLSAVVMVALARTCGQSSAGASHRPNFSRSLLRPGERRRARRRLAGQRVHQLVRRPADRHVGVDASTAQSASPSACRSCRTASSFCW